MTVPAPNRADALGPSQLAFCRQWVAFRELEAITERVRKEREASRLAAMVVTARKEAA